VARGKQKEITPHGFPASGQPNQINEQPTITMSTITTDTTLNGIDTTAIWEMAQAVAENPAKGQTSWHVTSHWRGGTRSDAAVREYHLGGERVAKNFTIKCDEPCELGGTNQFANPQEYLLAALNACMIVGYTVGCAMQGIRLDELRIETEGDIDLRGFLGLDPNVKPGYDSLHYTVHIRGDGTPEQFQQIHETVIKTSPNRFNLATAVPLNSRLVVG
jgi:uncharacterized OsmC-like protein